MADTVDQHFTVQYTTNWIHRVQQTKGRLTEFCDWQDFDGEFKRYDRLASMTPNTISARKSATVVSDATDDFRWCTASAADITNTLDEFDRKQLAPLVLPDSDYIKAHAASHHRWYDDEILSAAIAATVTGEARGGTDPILATAQEDTTAAALSVDKLRTLNRILDEADVDEGDSERVLVVSAKMKEQLLKDDEAISGDYARVKALVNGEVDFYMGFRFVQNQRLDNVSGDIYRAVAWIKGAIKGIKGPMMSHLDIIPEFRHMLQVRSVWRGGCCRMHNEMVAISQIDESA